MADEFQAILQAAIQAKVVEALNSTTDTIDKLVKAALSKPVDDQNGRTDGYHGRKVPFLDYLVGDEIRTATRNAVQKVVLEMQPQIEASVRSALSADGVAEAFTKAIVGATTEDWRLNVMFQRDKERG